MNYEGPCLLLSTPTPWFFVGAIFQPFHHVSTYGAVYNPMSPGVMGRVLHTHSFLVL